MDTIDVTFQQEDGTAQTLSVQVSGSLMEKAINSEIPGIEAKCRGSCSCVTCHVWVDDDWIDKLPPKSEMEASTLDFADELRRSSRLSCQINITRRLDGLIVHVPQQQRTMGLY